MFISTTKRFMAVLIAIVFTISAANAQAPQLMSFQSVVRNSSGVLVANHSVGLRLSILQGSITGTAVYVETQTATSNANRLVTLQIGGGTVVSGTFSSIDWSAGPYYIKSEIDPTGGTSYLVVGTTQLLSVAYALYANSAGSAKTTTSGTGTTYIAIGKTDVNVSFSSSTPTDMPEMDLTFSPKDSVISITFSLNSSCINAGGYQIILDGDNVGGGSFTGSQPNNVNDYLFEIVTPNISHNVKVQYYAIQENSNFNNSHFSNTPSTGLTQYRTLVVKDKP